MELFEHCIGCARYLRSCTGMSKEVCEQHNLRIPITNADRIRNMSDKELSKFMHSLKNKCGDCPVAKSNVFCSTFPTCEDAWLAWLRQEVEK